jgi:hypothetical protein
MKTRCFDFETEKWKYVKDYKRLQIGQKMSFFKFFSCNQKINVTATSSSPCRIMGLYCKIIMCQKFRLLAIKMYHKNQKSFQMLSESYNLTQQHLYKVNLTNMHIPLWTVIQSVLFYFRLKIMSPEPTDWRNVKMPNKSDLCKLLHYHINNYMYVL